jgi:hypothetical protein
MIAESFGKAGIVIAFPQRDIHLDAVRPLQVEVVSQADPRPENLTERFAHASGTGDGKQHPPDAVRSIVGQQAGTKPDQETHPSQPDSQGHQQA